MITLLLDSALKSTSILAAAWVAATLMRHGSADLRHRIWLAAIFAVAVMPALVALLPHSEVTIAVGSQLLSNPVRIQKATRAFPWLFTMWAAGAALVALRWTVGVFGIAQITRRASQRDGLHYSAQIGAPLTWGFLRPVIVLPASAADWTQAKRQIVIRHEQAHIDRQDWLWQSIARLVTAVFWFHPLMWLASAELRHEAERAVDDRVLSAGADPADYAEELLAVARSIAGAVPAQAVAMVRKPALESRVRSILDSTRSRIPAGGRVRAAIVLATVAAVLPLAAFQDATVHKMGEKGLTPPRVVSKVDPIYSQEAKDAKVEGTVVLQCVIDENGHAQSITVTKALGSGLDQKAIDAVNQWLFAPARIDGKPVKVQAAIEVNFHLI